MRILLATSAFHKVGGSEAYLLSVGENLLRLGHDVRFFAYTAGDMAALARRHGIQTHSAVADLGEPADAVIAQDGAVAYDVAAVWPEVPQVFVCHTSLFDFQQPPLVPDYASAVVVLNDRVRKRMEALNADLRIVRLTQPIDTQRFQPRNAPAERPRTALIFSNYLLGGARQVLVDVCAELDIEVAEVGKAATTMTPEERLNSADFVIAKGRSALEAMACGRPTYLYDVFGTDGWITPDNYEEIEAEGITGNQSDRSTSAAQVRADLEAYDASLGRLGRELVLRHHDARQHAHDLVELLRDVAPNRRSEGPTLEAELARQVSLRWASDAELFALRANFERVSGELERTRVDLSQTSEALSRANAEVSQVNAALLQAQAEVSEARAEVSRTDDQLAELRTDTTRLQEELTLTRQHADNLQRIRQDLEGKVADLRQTNRSQRRGIGDGPSRSVADA